MIEWLAFIPILFFAAVGLAVTGPVADNTSTKADTTTIKADRY